MSQIIELVIIGSENTEKEKIFSSLKNESLRNFKGMNFGKIVLDEEKELYIYFLNQEADSFYYLWDVLIPHAASTLVVCESDDKIFSANIEAINYINKNFASPCYVCAMNKDMDIGDLMNQHDLEFSGHPTILHETLQTKEDIRQIFIQMISL